MWGRKRNDASWPETFTTTSGTNLLGSSFPPANTGAALLGHLVAVTEGATRGLHQQNHEIEQAATAVNQMSAARPQVLRIRQWMRLQSPSIQLTDSAETIICLIASSFTLKLVDESLDLSLSQPTDAIKAHPAECGIQLFIEHKMAQFCCGRNRAERQFR